MTKANMYCQSVIQVNYSGREKHYIHTEKKIIFTFVLQLHKRITTVSRGSFIISTNLRYLVSTILRFSFPSVVLQVAVKLFSDLFICDEWLLWFHFDI